jgi:hypothetical protein
MLKKYAWYKTFNCPIDIENMPCAELDIILEIGARINKAEEEAQYRNRPKK